MSKIRVLHFELDENLGGIEIFLLNLYKQIDRDTVQFEFVTAAKEPALEEEFCALGGIIHHVAAHSDFANYCRDIRKLLANGINIVHIHKNSAANIVSLILSKHYGIKNIYVHSHNTSPTIGRISHLLHIINKPYLNKTATLKFACSTEAGKWLFTKDSFEILSNGIITDNYRFDNKIRLNKRKELRIGNNTKLIGHIGRFTPQKNQERAVDIFEAFHKMIPDSKMVLVGTGELQTRVTDYIVSKNMQKEILMLGLRHDVPELLMSMDAFLMPSLFEGLPIVAIEAQAAGLPLFLSDTISPEAEITNAVTWFDLEENDKDVAEKLKISLETNLYDRNKLLKQVIAQGYSMENTAVKMLDYYTERRYL